jgi:beta-lactamase regulating signal transducer with metallopeptidase domain
MLAIIIVEIRYRLQLLIYHNPAISQKQYFFIVNQEYRIDRFILSIINLEQLKYFERVPNLS